MAKTVYDEETKAMAIVEMLKGNSASYVSDKFNIPEGTLFAWRSEYGLANIKDTSLASQKKIEIGNLLMALLKQELVTLEAIAKAASDPVWLAKQRADSLAVFFGVMHDKNIKKIEALNGARNTD